jgi:UTP--glucose-1-phosphate uridylyltransferase
MEKFSPVIRKIVLPVAGLGKRLRPLTLKTPKGLVPVGGVPLLDYIFRETRGTATREVLLIVSPEHRPRFERYVGGARKRFRRLNFEITEQKQALGTGHAVLCAKKFVGREPFFMRFCDDLLFDKKPILVSMADFFTMFKKPIITLEKVPKRLVCRYGVVGVEKKSGKAPVYRLNDLVEKPVIEDAPSNLTIVGSYVLNYDIIKELIILDKKARREIDAVPLTDAFIRQIKSGADIYGWEFKGERLDCGTLAGLEEAENFIAKRRA